MPRHKPTQDKLQNKTRKLSSDSSREESTPVPRLSCHPQNRNNTARRVATEPYLHPFPKPLVVRQPLPESLKEAWLVGKRNKLLDEIALPKEDVKDHLVPHQHGSTCRQEQQQVLQVGTLHRRQPKKR